MPILSASGLFSYVWASSCQNAKRSISIAQATTSNLTHPCLSSVPAYHHSLWSSAPTFAPKPYLSRNTHQYQIPKHTDFSTFVLHCHWLQLICSFCSITRAFKPRQIQCIRHLAYPNHTGALAKRRSAMNCLLHQPSKVLKRLPKVRRSKDRLMHIL